LTDWSRKYETSRNISCPADQLLPSHQKRPSILLDDAPRTSVLPYLQIRSYVWRSHRFSKIFDRQGHPGQRLGRLKALLRFFSSHAGCTRNYSEYGVVERIRIVIRLSCSDHPCIIAE